MPATTPAKKRVIALCKAISNLHHGDLLTALKLDRVAPMESFGDDDTFRLAEEGDVIIHTPGLKPPEKSLKHRAGTGVDLGRILEQHLIWVMALGEVAIPTSQKAKGRYKHELGGREFHDD